MAAAERTFRFTDVKLKALELPTEGRLIVWDTEVRGLMLDVTPSGTKTFRFRKKIDGVSRRYLVERFDGTNYGHAKKKALQMAGKIAGGASLSRQVGERPGGPTVGEFFDRWLTEYAKAHRPGSWGHDLQLFDGHIRPVIGDKSLLKIDSVQLRQLHTSIAENIRSTESRRGPQAPHARTAGHRTANRMLQLLSAVFNCAKRWGVYQHENPTAGVQRFKESRRERYLQQDEAQQFFRELADPKTTVDTRDFILLGLFTGARRSNLMAMRWRDIDHMGALWTIPGESTKTGRAYHVPLVPPALEVLRQRLQLVTPGCDWVFPAASASGHLVSFQKQWDEFRCRAGMPDLRFHDLRHTLASWQAIAGTSLAIIGRGLGHSSTSTTARYAHLNVDPVRASMGTAAGAMLEAGRTKKQKPKKRGGSK